MKFEVVGGNQNEGPEAYIVKDCGKERILLKNPHSRNYLLGGFNDYFSKKQIEDRILTGVYTLVARIYKGDKVTITF